MSLLTLSPAAFCKATEACAEGREFALRYPTMAEVWDACPRPDWLLWICARLGQRPDHRALRLFAVWCARHTPLRDGRVTGDLLADPRLRAALDVAERYAHGRASEWELSVAARDAADATYAATYDAASATYAATCDAARATALADAAYYAAHAAAYAACAAVSAAAYAAAHDAARASQADQFRRMVPNPFRT